MILTKFENETNPLLYGVNDMIFDIFDIYLTKFIELLLFVDRIV